MSKEYDEYLEEHIGAAKCAVLWMLKNIKKSTDCFTSFRKFALLLAMEAHDASKYDGFEYDAYDNYFYGERDEEEFNLAWLRHIHKNPHHWQHWILINDDGKVGDSGKMVALEMPEIFALEMVADWWSFSWRSGNLYQVFDWYEEHKDGIILHENTRAYVESVLDEIRSVLDSGMTC